MSAANPEVGRSEGGPMVGGPMDGGPRVLHILAEPGWSGGEVQLDHVVQGLHDAGYRQHLCLVPGAGFIRTGERLGLPMTFLPLRRPWRLDGWWRLRRLAAGGGAWGGFDAIHFGCGRTLLWGGLALRGMTFPLRFTSRRIDYPIRPTRWHGGRYTGFVDLAIANCMAIRKRLVDGGMPDERALLIHEGIDMSPWLPAREHRAAGRQALGIPDDAVVVSCAATLRPRKGQADLIEAFAQVAEGYPKAMLVLAGGGPDREKLQQLAREKGLAHRILVPGPVKPVIGLYGASDLFCMPSYNEGLSNACLEAGAAGLPQMVSPAGGLPEIVRDGDTGAVIPAGDPDAWADGLRRYLGDGELRARHGAAGREHVTNSFTAERMQRAFVALLDERLGVDRSQPPTR